jgi:hypothetical protein
MGHVSLRRNAPGCSDLASMRPPSRAPWQPRRQRCASHATGLAVLNQSARTTALPDASRRDALSHAAQRKSGGPSPQRAPPTHHVRDWSFRDLRSRGRPEPVRTPRAKGPVIAPHRMRPRRPARPLGFENPLNRCANIWRATVSVCASGTAVVGALWPRMARLSKREFRKLKLNRTLPDDLSEVRRDVRGSACANLERGHRPRRQTAARRRRRHLRSTVGSPARPTWRHSMASSRRLRGACVSGRRRPASAVDGPSARGSVRAASQACRSTAAQRVAPRAAAARRIA